jgi:dCTP deaminase
MILTGNEIHNEIIAGNIEINPFDPKRLNPNSYNLSLGSELAVYRDAVLDMKNKSELVTLPIPDEGFMIQPDRLYLASTVERTHTDKYVPILSGRSSVGRLGISIHVTAGFGDIGFNGKWTLEIFCIEPVIIYPNVQICQIYFEEPKGQVSLYRSKYNNNNGIQGSMLWKDFG